MMVIISNFGWDMLIAVMVFNHFFHITHIQQSRDQDQGRPYDSCCWFYWLRHHRRGGKQRQ
ncbi:hypothetical protein V8B55DRAFT_1450769 [Mucor lusitanicus]